MELEQAIYARRAVREYSEEPVAKPTLLKLIEAAIQAPSAVNEQSWLFTVVQDRALLAGISHEAKAHLLREPPASLAPQHLRELLEEPAFDIFYHAPALIVISNATHGPWAVENCALAAQNLMLSACAAGLGSCWIGFAQPWLATPEGKAALHLPPMSLPVAPIIVGHAKSPSPAVRRQAPQIHWIGA